MDNKNQKKIGGNKKKQEIISVNQIKKIKTTEPEVLSDNERALLEKIIGGESLKYARVSMAALGSLPWVGAIINAASTLSSENEQQDTNRFIYLWIKEHEEKLNQLARDLNKIFEKFKKFGNRINKRIESDEYLSLVKATFAKWDRAETLEKRDMLRRLITNAGGISIVQDDWVGFFLEWIEKYNKFHFQVIAEIYKKPNITRREIWMNIKGKIPEEHSAEADLFKLLIRDLSTGGVIRQKSTSKTKNKSAFDYNDPYILTELGSQFVHYAMKDLTIQIEDKNS